MTQPPDWILLVLSVPLLWMVGSGWAYAWVMRRASRYRDVDGALILFVFLFALLSAPFAWLAALQGLQAIGLSFAGAIGGAALNLAAAFAADLWALRRMEEARLWKSLQRPVSPSAAESEDGQELPF